MSKTALQPLGSHVLVRRATPTEKSKGGIVLPEKAKEKPQEGVVVSTGNGKILEDGKRQQMQVKAGDRVLFTTYGGTEVKHNDETYLVVEESDLLAVIA